MLFSDQFHLYNFHLYNCPPCPIFTTLQVLGLFLPLFPPTVFFPLCSLPGLGPGRLNLTAGCCRCPQPGGGSMYRTRAGLGLLLHLPSFVFITKEYLSVDEGFFGMTVIRKKIQRKRFKWSMWHLIAARNTCFLKVLTLTICNDITDSKTQTSLQKVGVSVVAAFWQGRVTWGLHSLSRSWRVGVFY